MSMSKRKCLKRDEYFECISIKTKAMTVGDLKKINRGCRRPRRGAYPCKYGRS